jgi:radical SAM protein with 4Fe4S-binding SPASM domain
MPNELPNNLAELLAKLDAEDIHDYRRYREVRKFFDFKAREKYVPVSATFELTPLCNLDCKMCYVHLNREQLNGASLLTTEQWKDLMRQSVEAGVMFASLTGGECLTYPGFKELYLYLFSMGIQVTVLSNGILMNDDIIELFKKYPPARIQITLYGASEDGYEKVTGHRVFNKVVGNIKKLKEANMPISIAVTPNEFMGDGVDTVRFLNDMKIDFNVNPSIIPPRDETGREVHDANLDTYVEILRTWREITGGEIYPECDEESLPSVGGNQDSSIGIKCAAGRSSFAIAWNGEMKPCNTFPCEPQHPIEVGVEEAWEGLTKIAKNYRNPSECEGCKFYYNCKHCAVEHAMGAPIGHANPATCEWTKRMIKEGIYKLVENPN